MWPIRTALVLASTLLLYSNAAARAEPYNQVLQRAEAYKQPALKLLGVLAQY